MILGLLAIIGLLVIRLWPLAGPDATSAAGTIRPGVTEPGGAPALPDRVVLPEGEQVLSVTVAEGWLGVVTVSGRIFFFSEDGALIKEVSVALPE